MHFRRRHRIVLVHDGDGAQLAQAINGALRIASTVAVAGIGGGEEDLADGALIARKGLAPHRGQVHLADGRGGLLGSQIGGPLVQAERAHTCGNRTGRDNDDIGAAHARMDGINDVIDLFLRNAEIFIRERRGTNLDHHALCLRDVVAEIRFKTGRHRIFIERLRERGISGRSVKRLYRKRKDGFFLFIRRHANRVYKAHPPAHPKNRGSGN